ncbi:efflux RND transporter periplasmic adaptor subunit [Stenotrophomonas maltophilia]|uniref:efflux RND transporter periplasmic adaptor subunit n=1 Tax=Stenotrophomonas maltophilia TaxID=40324 RepID=UPI0013DD2204
MKQEKKASLGASATIVAVCLSLAGCQKAEPPAPPPPPPEVGVLTLQPQSVQLSARLPGRAVPYLVAEVRPQVGGILRERAFTEGSSVKAGQLLYQIDPAPYRAVLSQAEASLEAAQSLARRYEQLIKTHAISQQEHDDARARYLQARAAAESARIDLGYTRITAPIAGRIGRSAVTQGALLTANQANTLATIQQLDPIYVDIIQPATVLMQLRDDLASGRLKSTGDGQAEIRLTLENGRDYGHAGKLQFSEVSVDQSTGAVTLRAVFPNPERVLMPGMFVTAQLQEGTREQALLVPQRGVTRDSQGRAQAWVVDGQNRAQLRALATERSVDGQWLIRDGLNAGDRVIVDGVQRVQPGIEVRPVPATVTGATDADAAGQPSRSASR